jgi:outer membrane immunogenic protein
MKRILLTTAALGVLGLGSPALGADLPMYSKAPVAPPVYDWTGFYVGGFGGYGFGNHNLVFPPGPNNGFANFDANWESHGGFGGGEIGYNWQSGELLFGIEADGVGANINGTDNSAIGQNGFAQIDSNKLKWVASLRARGGITVDRLLLFFDGGWAVGDVDHTDINPGVGVDKFSNHRNGLAAGGGLAYAITNNLIGKVEYRYYDLGTYHRTAPTDGVAAYNVSNTYSTVLLGLDYKFGGSPVVAKY